MAIIEVNHLTKEYQLGNLTSLKETALNTLRRLTFQPKQERERFKALDDVNFSIEEGEVVGIIGHNGAGKSTLLKHLANISKPTKGNVIVRGSVAPLIEVGAGVNPELTGRENIFLNGAILGIPKRIIKQKLDEIIEFAELEQFIDTPVKRYSSGMTVKLGFSIATSMDADILIIDEVLAVGDLAFQRKCFDRMENLIKHQGKTVLIVSHNIRQIERICSRCVLLSQGRISQDGDSKSVCTNFHQHTINSIHEQHQKVNQNLAGVSSSGEVKIRNITLSSEINSIELNEFEMHDPMLVKIEVESNVVIEYPEIVVGIHTSDFIYIATSTTAMRTTWNTSIKKGNNTFMCTFDDLMLTPGVFSIRIAILDKNKNMLWYGENLKQFKVISTKISPSNIPVLGLVDLPASWSSYN